jgi:hypothetical protein
LDLQDNEITSVPPEIGQLVNLQALYLSDNKLTSVPLEIGQLANLRSLILSGNKLITVPSEIGQLANLQELYLSDNDLTSLPPEIGQLANLEELYLSGNALTGLPPEIGRLTNLGYLDLSQNVLTSLPPEIGQLDKLHYLDLRDNALTSLPPGIWQLPNLNDLWLDGNPLEAPPSIPFDSEEYVVYSTLLRTRYVTHNTERIVIEDYTDTHGYIGQNAAKFIQGSLTTLSPDTLRDFLGRNQQGYLLNGPFDVGVEVTLLSDEKLKEMFRDDQGWDRFYEQFPHTPGIVTLSRVGFNATHDQALVYVGNQRHWLAGAGYYVLFTLKDGEWTLEQDVMVWIS